MKIYLSRPIFSHEEMYYTWRLIKDHVNPHKKCCATQHHWSCVNLYTLILHFRKSLLTFVEAVAKKNNDACSHTLTGICILLVDAAFVTLDFLTTMVHCWTKQNFTNFCFFIFCGINENSKIEVHEDDVEFTCRKSHVF